VQSSQDTRLRTVIARGLSRPENSSSQRGEAWRREARQLPERHNNGPRLIRHAYAIGLLGLAAGPDVHIVDHLALTDPLLARLPAAYDPMPLAGHFERMGQWSSPIPVTKKCPSRFEVCQFWRDYEASLRSGACQLADAQLCGYWRDLRLVTEGPLLSAERFRAIVRLNLARRDPRIDRRRYRNAVREYPGVKAREDTRGP
jgi:arabinofuranosyltransferase